MAGNSDNAADRFWAQTSWHWLEREFMKAQHPQVPTEQIDDYLDRRWNELPQDFKDSPMPAVTQAHQAMQHMAQVQHLLNAAVCWRKGAWQTASVGDMDCYAGHYVTVDERLRVLQMLRVARENTRTALLALDQARKAFSKKELLSVESERTLQDSHESIRNDITAVDGEIAQWTADAPELRQADAKWRQGRRDDGLPSEAGWVGS